MYHNADIDHAFKAEGITLSPGQLDACRVYLKASVETGRPTSIVELVRGLAPTIKSERVGQ